MNNNNLMKMMLLILVGIYVISPVDLAPGPIDDLLLILLTAASNMKQGSRSSELPDDVLEGKWRE